jgi:hypothetical protein
MRTKPLKTRDLILSLFRDLILSLSKDEAKISSFSSLLILGLKFPGRIMLVRIPAAQARNRLGLDRKLPSQRRRHR